MTDLATTPTVTATSAPAAVPVKRIVAALVALGVAGGALVYYLHARHLEDTDDAQIDGEITNVSSRVAGTIVTVAVKDNQTVAAGDVMAELDPTDYEVAVAQARAVLAQAEAAAAAENPSVSMTETSNMTSLSSAEADVSSTESGLVAADRDIKQLTAQLELAQANAKNAESERQRGDKLGASGSISAGRDRPAAHHGRRGRRQRGGGGRGAGGGAGAALAGAVPDHLGAVARGGAAGQRPAAARRAPRQRGRAGGDGGAGARAAQAGRAQPGVRQDRRPGERHRRAARR